MKKKTRQQFDIGNRIRLLRESRNLTREAFEELSDVSAKYLYELEMAQKDCTTSILIKICKALNTSSDYILFGDSIREAEAISLLKQLDDKNLDLAVAILRTILLQSKL